MQLKRKSVSRRSTTSSSSWRGIDKEKVRSEKRPKKVSEPFQVRYIASQYPNKRAMILRDNGGIESDSLHGDTSTSSDSKSHSDDSHVEGDLLMMRRLMCWINFFGLDDPWFLLLTLRELLQ
ncbi:hypothetical protein CR513_61407, partial [Mucuna pruriens]